MKVVIRVDGNKYVGIGHVMRCLTIAEVFRDRGYEVHFIIADEESSAAILSHGFSLELTHTFYTDMESEINEWSELRDVSYIIIDSYYVTNRYLEALYAYIKPLEAKLICFNDIPSYLYPVDVIVNYSFQAIINTYADLYPKGHRPQLILGIEYVPLRSMFKDVEKKIQPKCVRKIFFSTGGSDELNLLYAIVTYLIKCKTNHKYEFHLLMGTMNQYKEQLYKAVDGIEYIVLHENVIDMKGLIQMCDLAISAAGTTLYEIASCGVPIITYSIADNQINGAESFEKMGLAINIGDLRNIVDVNMNSNLCSNLRPDAVKMIIRAVYELANDYEKRKNMGENLQQLIDGRGAERLVKKILEF